MLLETIGAALRTTPPDFEAGTRALRALLASGYVRRFANDALPHLLDVPSAPPGLPASRVRIHRSPALRIDATPVRGALSDSVTVGMATRHTLIANVGAAPLRVRRFHQPQPEPHDVFDPARRLQRLDDLVVPPGEVTSCSALTGAYQFAADVATVALVASGPHQSALRWHYDVRSLRPVRATPTDDAWLRIRELLKFAEVVGDPSVVPALDVLGEHPSHFVRWAAAQTVLRISRHDGVRWLRAAAADPHPQIRAAAARALAAEGS